MLVFITIMTIKNRRFTMELLTNCSDTIRMTRIEAYLSA